MQHRSLLLAGFLIFAALALACSTPPRPKSAGRSGPAATGQALSQPEAADLAAYLANASCELHFGKKPFLPSHWTAELTDGRWHWGHWDPAGVGGYSAIVSFDADGGHPESEVFFSSDRDTSIGPPQIEGSTSHGR